MLSSPSLLFLLFLLSFSLSLSLFNLLPRFALSSSSSSSFLCRLCRTSIPPSPLRSRIPHSTPPKGLLPRSYAPRCPLATSSRPVAAWPLLACLLETLLQPEASSLHTKPLQPADHITTLHVTHYKLPSSPSFSFFPSTTCSSSLTLSPLGFFRRPFPIFSIARHSDQHNADVFATQN